MKIISAEKYYFITGGASRVFFETNKLLEDKGHQVIPFTGRYPENFKSPYEQYFVPRFTLLSGEENSKVSIYKYLKAFFDALYAFDVEKAVSRMIEDHHPDMAHLHTILYQLSPSLIKVLKRYDVPVVQTLHDFSLYCSSRYLYSSGEICERCKGKKYFNVLLQNCYNRNFLMSFMSFSAKVFHNLLKLYPGEVDLFISPSRFLRDKMIEWGLPKEKIIHIDHFLSPARFPSPVNEKSDYFVFAGYLIRQKGIFTLLNAMKTVKNAKLVILGRGPEKENVEKKIKEYRLDNVEMRGFQSGKKLFDTISKAQFTVFPSEWYETFGMGILESFFLGTPVIASDIGAYSELIHPGENGFVFEAGNHQLLSEKINELFADRSLSKKMARTARDHAVRNYNEDIHYQRLMSAYSKIKRT